MKSFSESCFEALAATKPPYWTEPLVKSMVTDADIQQAEAFFGYSFPEDFKEFLKSYLAPSDWIFGRFGGEWPGGEITYSFEKDDYLCGDDIPDDLEICTLHLSLSPLREIAKMKEGTLEETIEKVTWTKTASLGYILLGEFKFNYYVFLECATGEIIRIDHDYYTCSYGSELENLQCFKHTLFKSFKELLECLFLGAVCDGGTGEIIPEGQEIKGFV